MAIENKNWYKWLVVAFLWTIGCLNYMDRQAIFSVFPILSKELGMSDVQLGLLGSVFLWVYLRRQFSQLNKRRCAGNLRTQGILAAKGQGNPLSVAVGAT